MATAQRATLHATGVMPSLTVNRIDESLNFFSRLGFEVQEKWEEGGTLVGAMMKAGDAQLGLSQDDGKKGRDRMKGVGMRIYIEAKDNIDEVASRAKAAGIKLKSEPHTTEWGSRAFDVQEPSGFLLTISSPSSPST
jgi:uncharacterized glyoxalase superfamily protein PhnB